MAHSFQFDLVSPEKMVASLEVDEVVLPATDGEMTAKPGHAPFVTTLRPGLVIAHQDGQMSAYAVTGGFAEVSETAVSVLAEEAIERSDFDREALQKRIALVMDRLEVANEQDRQSLEAQLNDLRNLEITMPDL